ncbi:DUF4282 domain-containing protein [Nitratifractor sp.]
MNTLMDFLSFRLFVTPSVLIVFYYLGAVVMPLLGWWIGRSLYRRIRGEDELQREEEGTKPPLSDRANRPVLITLFLFCFLCMELGWRMLFEFLIAYFQIHDALVGLPIHG